MSPKTTPIAPTTSSVAARCEEGGAWAPTEADAAFIFELGAGVYAALLRRTMNRLAGTDIWTVAGVLHSIIAMLHSVARALRLARGIPTLRPFRRKVAR